MKPWVYLLGAIPFVQSFGNPSLAQTSQQRPGAMTSPAVRAGHSPICPQDMVATKVSGLSPVYYPNLSQEYINKANAISITAFGTKYVCINYYGQISSAYWRQSSSEQCREDFIKGSRDIFYYCVKPGVNWGKSTAQLEDFNEIASAFKVLTSALRGNNTNNPQANPLTSSVEGKEIDKMRIYSKNLLCSPTSGLKKKEDVIRECNSLVSGLPSDSEAYLQRGNTVITLYNDSASACADFKKAISLNSDPMVVVRAESQYKTYCQERNSTGAQALTKTQKSGCMSAFMDKYMKGQVSPEQARLEFMKCQSIK